MATTMIPAAESEDRPAYDVLANKTMEILDVVNCTRQLLVEKYNNDQTMWLEAMFRVLMVKNSLFLVEEKCATVRDRNVNKILKDQILEMYRTSDEQNYWLCGAGGQRKSSTAAEVASDRTRLLETSSTLIASFRVFTSFLIQTKLDVKEEIPNLQTVAKNIEKYVQRCAAAADEEKEKEKPRPKVSKEEVAAVVAPAPPPVESNSKIEIKIEERRSSTPAEANTSDRLCDTCKEPIVMFNDDEDFSMILHEQDSKHVEAVKKKMAATATASAAAKSGDNVDSSSVPLVKSLSPDDNVGAGAGSGSNSKVAPSASDEAELLAAISKTVGPVHAKFFRIITLNDFHCTACGCQIASVNNILAHVQGAKHTKNCGGIKGRESRSGSESRAMPTPVEVGAKSKKKKAGKSSDVGESEARKRSESRTDSDSAEDSVLRVSSAIPVKSLF